MAEESWILSASGAGARSFHQPDTEFFSQGATGSVGVYRSLVPKIQLGGRVGGTWLPADETPTGYDNSDLGIGTVTAMMRVRPLGNQFQDSRAEGLWLEAGGGPAIVNNDVTAAAEAGIGYNFDVGDVTVGPNIRYMQAIETDSRFVSEDVRIGAIGVELTFGDSVKPRQRMAKTPAQPQTTIVNNYGTLRTVDTDRDGIADSRDLCPEAHAARSEDPNNDGCVDSTAKASGDDESVVRLDEPVFFDTDSSELSAEGTDTLREVATRYHAANGEWNTIRVVGHADRRGAFDYNAELAANRARTVKAGLTKMGVPSHKIDVSTWGEAMPLTEANDQMALGINRRVEFIVEM